MRRFVCAISLFLISGILSHSTENAPTARITECEEVLVSQDEVIKLLDQQATELKGAIEARKAQVEALQHQIAALQEQADLYRKMWIAEAEVAKADRKRAVWSELWTGMKWGLVGFGTGIVLERAAE